jgi:hypothetical protein
MVAACRTYLAFFILCTECDCGLSYVILMKSDGKKSSDILPVVLRVYLLVYLRTQSWMNNELEKMWKEEAIAKFCSFIL